ncbi:MAG: twin-arginine translocase subunit TatC [Dehalococcoidia bacterium]|nr:twin-arginine translocase subunit TatC [Dehalococcoidia bacterium]
MAASPDRPRPLRAHLEELRRRLLWSGIALAVGVALSVVFYEDLVKVLLRPAEGHLSITSRPIYTEVTELLGVIVRISLLGGVVVALPFLVHQIALFIAPALNSAERRLAVAFVPAAFLLFAAGVLFSYFVLLPPALRFLLTFGEDLATPMIRIGSYMNLVITLLFWMGLVFETPLAMFLLAKLRIVSYRGFVRAQRWVLVGAFLLGAIVTPTFDPLNQSLVAMPLIVLYELGIGVAWLVRARGKTAPRTAGAPGA